MIKNKPTVEQQHVIDSQGHKLAISASAGSGKTTTVINRIAEIIKQGKTSFDQLLVLTFTDASAQDMRQKLKKQLCEAWKTDVKLQGLYPSIDDLKISLQAAAIGTFHSFCSSIVRAWFTVAEVNPSFAVMDTVESNKLKADIFEKVVLEQYENVRHAVDLFAASRNLDELRSVVFAIQDFLDTREDKTMWIQKSALAAYDTNINQNQAVQYLIDDYHETARKYRQLFIELNHVSPQVNLMIDVANQILAAQNYTDFQSLQWDFPRLKKEADFVLYDEFKELRKRFINDVCKVLQEQFKFPISDVQADITKDRKVVQQLIDLVQAFDTAYSAKKIEFKKLDYNDLEKYALKVLENSEALAAIRQQSKYIFVDEGQDTNPVQFRIIDILRGDDKFFCIVGDVKQSIYGFRDCEPELFEKFTGEDHVEKFHLNRNWRSVNSILHYVNEVMGRLMAEYNQGHKFDLNEPDEAAARLAYLSRQIEQAKKDLIVLLKTQPQHEFIEKAQQLHEEIEKSARFLETIGRENLQRSGSEIVKIYEQLKAAEALTEPVKVEIAEDMESQMAMVLTQIKQSNLPLQDIAVLAETSAPLQDLQKYLADRGIPSVIDRSSDALQEREIILLNHFLFAAMNPTNELSRYLVLQYLFHCTNDDLARLRLGKIDISLQTKIDHCDAILTRYRALGREQSAYEVLTQAATEFGMLEMPVVNAFLGAIRGVGDFDTVARYLYLVEHQLVSIEVNVGANVNDAVKLMTIHHSKGLEFPMVILFQMGSSWVRRHRPGKIIMDKNLGICVASLDTDNYVEKSQVLRLGIAKYQQSNHLKEMQRLLYVALTRPKNKLYITGCWKKDPYRIRPDCMLDLLNPVGVEQQISRQINPVEKIKVVDSAPSIQTCQFQGNSDVFVKQSVTALATAAEPFQDYVAPVKYEGEGGKAFGTAYHRELQYGELPAVVQQLVAGYTTYRELPFLYEHQNTIVQGIMDLLAVKDSKAIIVDYKTTRLPQSALIEKYREQLRLYAQALPNYEVDAYIYSTVHDELIKVSF